MWERIGESSAVIIGAAVLFLLFAAVLLIIERSEFKERRKKHTRPYLVPKPNGANGSVRHLHSSRVQNTCNDIKVRKIS